MIKGEGVGCNEWQGYDIRSNSFREAKPECTEAHKQTKKYCAANENISTIQASLCHS